MYMDQDVVKELKEYYAKELATVHELIASGGDLNALDKDGNALIHKLENSDAIKLIVENGADINLLNKKGMTALHIAAEDGNHEKLSLLIGMGADINKLTKDKQTALELSYDVEMDIFLVENGLDLTVIGSDGKTALKHAIGEGCYCVAELILSKYTGNVNAKDRDGNTALHGVEDYELAQELIKHGADITINNKLGLTPLDLMVEVERTFGDDLSDLFKLLTPSEELQTR